MTKTEIATLRNVIARLKQPNCGCRNDLGAQELVTAANALGLHVCRRSTWLGCLPRRTDNTR